MIRGINDTPIIMARIVIPTGSSVDKFPWIASVIGFSIAASIVSMSVPLSYVLFIGTNELTEKPPEHCDHQNKWNIDMTISVNCHVGIVLGF